MSRIDVFTRSIVAVIVIGGGLYLISRGIDTVVGGMMLGVIAFYFGGELIRRRR